MPSLAPTATIRPIQTSDKDAWIGLWEQYNVFYKRTIPAEVTEANFKRFLDPQDPICWAVATLGENSSPIGFASYYPHPSTASTKPNFYLHDLFVDPACRAGGVGQKLIDFVVDRAREADAYQLYWHTQYFNYRAQGLYSKVGERSDFVMWKKGL